MIGLGCPGGTLPTNVPQLFASAITMPNLTIQVRNDAWTKNPEDAQKTVDMLGTKDKEMIWVENRSRRSSGPIQAGPL